MLSHELRTPLTPVMMATQMLAKRTDLPDPVREALAMIRRNIQLESRFVDELLDITKIERGKMELDLAPMDLHEAIAHAVEVSRPDIEAKGQTLTRGAGGAGASVERRLLPAATGRLESAEERFEVHARGWRNRLADPQ